jgi:hypothetical protein
MRRNAESLLRLAGSEPQRQMSAPIELGDVVRGALGEVEDYQRVQVRGLDPAAVPGGVGADLAHALAELMENALAFSPPTEPVEVRGRRTADGYVIAVADAGLGMTPDELEIANRRLAGEESFTVAPSRYLGHYVAGYLASRLGVRIELQPGPAGGIVARVDIPAAVLADTPAEPRPLAALKPVVEHGQVAEPARSDTWMASDAPFGDEPVLEPEAPAPVPPDPVAPVASVAPVAPVAAAPSLPTPTAGTEPGALPRRQPAPAAPAPTADLFTPAPPAPPSPTAGFGGLATVTNGNGDGHGAANGTGTTPSGLVRRVPGAQHPTTEIGAGRNGSGGPDRSDAERMSADAVSSFLSDFSAGVSRGIAETGHNPWEDGDEPR